MIMTIEVVVPAADEEETIGACLAGIDVARDTLARSAHAVPARVTVVLDDCHDRTAAIVAGHRGVAGIGCTARSVGAARRAGTDSVLARTDDPRSVWLAHTDADSVVPARWLLAQVLAADLGAELVVGSVVPQPGLAAATERAWYSRHDLVEDHPYVHGANLGIRGDAYLAVGGWEDVAIGEDVSLVARAVAAGLIVHRTATIPVSTSSRVAARAPDGFAGYLRRLELERGEVAI